MDIEEDFDIEKHWTYDEVMRRREEIEDLEDKAHDLEEIDENDPEATRLRESAERQEDELNQWIIQVDKDEGLNDKLVDGWHDQGQDAILLTILTTTI